VEETLGGGGGVFAATTGRSTHGWGEGAACAGPQPRPAERKRSAPAPHGLLGRLGKGDSVGSALIQIPPSCTWASECQHAVP